MDCFPLGVKCFECAKKPNDRRLQPSECEAWIWQRAEQNRLPHWGQRFGVAVVMQQRHVLQDVPLEGSLSEAKKAKIREGASKSPVMTCAAERKGTAIGVKM